MHALLTDRLTISEFSLADADFILELVNTPSWIKFIGDRNIHTKNDAVDYLTKGPLSSYKQHGLGLFKVQLSIGSLPIGMCGLLKRDELDNPDIGFAFLPGFEGQGYGFESSKAVLDDARDRLGIKQVLAITVKSNKRSIHLSEKLGLQFTKMINMHGDPEPLMLFSGETGLDKISAQNKS